MRIPIALILLPLTIASGASAQVSVDLRALEDAPPAAPPARPAPRARAVPAPAAATPAENVVSAPAVVPPSPSAPVATAALPALPVAKPAPPPLSSLAAATPSPPASPPPPPVRLVFAPEASALTSAQESAVRDMARAIPAPSLSAVTVTAYASGNPNDPSTPRRLSLARGMAVRAVLLESGILSAQIYVRALGAQPAGAVDEPADRVDLSVARIGEVTR
jgi:outer membrane protein OmpA-like peptidoglycan-associated protein